MIATYTTKLLLALFLLMPPPLLAVEAVGVPPTGDGEPPDGPCAVALDTAEATPGYDASMAAGDACLTVMPSAAVEAYQAALQEIPGSFEAKIRLSGALVEAGQWEELVEVTTSILEAMPTHAGAAKRKGLALYHLGRYDESEAMYQEVLDTSPDDATAHLGLAWALIGQKRTSAAKTHCEAATGAAADAVAECLAATTSPGEWKITTALYGGGFWYDVSSGGTTPDSYGASQLVFDVKSPSGHGFALDIAGTFLPKPTPGIFGAGMGQGGTRIATEMALGIAGTLALDRAWITAHLAVVTNDEPLPGDGTIISLDGGWSNDLITLSLGADAALYTPITMLQASPEVQVSLWGGLVQLSLMGRGQTFTTDGVEDAPEPTLSIEGGLALVPLPWLALRVSGWYGARYLTVDEGGTVVYDFDESYTGGFSLGLGIDMGSSVSVTASYRYLSGDLMLGEESDFSVSGLVGGLVVTF